MDIRDDEELFEVDERVPAPELGKHGVRCFVSHLTEDEIKEKFGAKMADELRYYPYETLIHMPNGVRFFITAPWAADE